MPLRLDGYIRVSRVSGRDGESFISPALQREKIETYCATHGHQLVHVWEELDESGARRDRPKWTRMLDRVERGQTDGVIVSKLDRFSRDVVSGLMAIERIEAAGGSLVLVDEQVDSSTPIGRMVLQMLLSVAEWFRSQTAAGWKETHRRVVARGVHVASPAVGYRRRDDGRLEPDPDAAPVVREAFVMRARGESTGAVAAMLNGAGVTTSRGNRWTAGTVTRLFASRVYLGEARAPGLVNPDGHEPIVDPATHALANAARTTRGPNQGRHLLSGLVRCAGCRYTMAATNGRWPTYQCRGQHPAGRCEEQAAASVRLLEEHIEALFLAEIGAGLIARAAAPAASRADFERAEREVAAWQDAAVEISEIGKDEYLAGLRSRVERRDAALAELAVQLDADGGHVDLPEAPLAGAWAGLALDQRRELVAAAIDAVVLRRGRSIPLPERVLVLWRGHGEWLPRKGDRVSVIRPLHFDRVDA